MDHRSQTLLRRWRFAAALTALVGLGACGGDDSTGPEAMTPEGDVGLQVTPPAMPIPPIKAKATFDNGNGTFTYTQDITSGYAFGGCRYYSQDSGWQHTFPGYAQPGRAVMSVQLTVVAWDVDAEPWHGWDGEYDGIFVDGVQLNPGYLQGSNGTWSTTVFDVPASRITDDGNANVWVDIDMHHNRNTWCTQMGTSTLKVVYRDGPLNNPPFQPQITLSPTGAPDVETDLGVAVVGPTPADPDGHAVTYSYRWFLDTGTGGFLDPQVHGRGAITGPTVPASATRVGDQWRVEVTPRDELGAAGDYAVATFPKITPVLNHPPQPAISLIRGAGCPDPYLEGGAACISGGGTSDPDQDVSTLAFHWDFGDGTTLDWTGVQGMPSHTYADNGTYTVTLTVTDAKGASASTTAEVLVANVAPTVDAEPDATVNWGEPYTVTAAFSDAGALDGAWHWTIQWGDGSSSEGDASSPGPVQAAKSYHAVGSYTVTACITDKDGGEGCDATQVEVVDPTPPVITFSLSGTAGDNGWFTSPVTLTWSVQDPESPFTTEGCEEVVQGTDGPHAYSCTATSAGGASSKEATFKIDQAPPAIAYSGNAGTYDIAAQVAVYCSVSDATSGVAFEDCADVVGAAWEFGLGEKSFTASATDHAGNVGSGQTSFTVTASFGGLCSLVQAWVGSKGIANSLCVKLDAAAKASARGNMGARDGALSAFVNEVQAQKGKAVPEDKAAWLVLFAQALMS